MHMCEIWFKFDWGTDCTEINLGATHICGVTLEETTSCGSGCVRSALEFSKKLLDRNIMIYEWLQGH